MDLVWRENFNRKWTDEQYQFIYQSIKKDFGHDLPFRISETPAFLDDDFIKTIYEAAEEVVNQVTSENLLKLSYDVFKICPYRVPGDDLSCPFFQIDFGLVKDDIGKIVPKLIELQGFPSLYYFQPYLARLYREAFNLDPKLSIFLNDMKEENYMEELKAIILGDEEPQNVVMLEIEPETQNTYVDFLCTEKELGIKILCISKVIKEGRNLYYIDDLGNKIGIKRIYNRIIFDELVQRNDSLEYNLLDDVDVSWAGHPNWFFRLSKFIMPHLTGKYIPHTYYLNEVNYENIDLSNFVLKPLFSFAGSGVELDITLDKIKNIPDPQNYILQEKVEYADIIQTPDGYSKCEMRVMFLWSDPNTKPKIVSNLLRMSKGKMIGVKYNKNKTWVGGSVGFLV